MNRKSPGSILLLESGDFLMVKGPGTYTPKAASLYVEALALEKNTDLKRLRHRVSKPAFLHVKLRFT